MVQAMINYAARGDDRPRYFANDHARDTVVIDAHAMPVEPAAPGTTTLDREGFIQVEHRSAVADFADPARVAAIHRDEIAELIGTVTRADSVMVQGGGVLRFAERSALSGQLDNSRPARFAHVDVSDMTAAEFAARATPDGRKIRRYAHYNIWRAITPPPQDVPLALCEAGSFSTADLIFADAIFDRAGQPDWSFEGLVFAHGAGHRWRWFEGLDRDHPIIFKTCDSESANAHCVPHVAFDNPYCPEGVPPRGSIEMRTIAYWFGE